MNTEASKPSQLRPVALMTAFLAVVLLMVSFGFAGWGSKKPGSLDEFVAFVPAICVSFLMAALGLLLVAVAFVVRANRVIPAATFGLIGNCIALGILTADAYTKFSPIIRQKAAAEHQARSKIYPELYGGASAGSNHTSGPERWMTVPLETPAPALRADTVWPAGEQIRKGTWLSSDDIGRSWAPLPPPPGIEEWLQAGKSWATKWHDTTGCRVMRMRTPKGIPSCELLWSTDGTCLYIMIPSRVICKVTVPAFAVERAISIKPSAKNLMLTKDGIAFRDGQTLILLDATSLEERRRYNLKGISWAAGVPSLSSIFLVRANVPHAEVVKLNLADTDGELSNTGWKTIPGCRLALSPDGKLLAFADSRGTPQLLALDTSQKRDWPRAGLSFWNGGKAEFSADSRYLMQSGDAKPSDYVYHGAYVYAVDDLRFPLFARSSSTHPSHFAVDPVYHYVYDAAGDFGVRMVHSSGIDEWSTGGEGIVHLLPHPRGNRLLALTSAAVYWVELTDAPPTDALANRRSAVQHMPSTSLLTEWRPMGGVRISELAVNAEPDHLCSQIPLSADGRHFFLLTTDGHLARVNTVDLTVASEIRLDGRFNSLAVTQRGLAVLRYPAGLLLFDVDTLEQEPAPQPPDVLRIVGSPSSTLVCANSRDRGESYMLDLVTGQFSAAGFNRLHTPYGITSDGRMLLAGMPGEIARYSIASLPFVCEETLSWDERSPTAGGATADARFVCRLQASPATSGPSPTVTCQLFDAQRFSRLVATLEGPAKAAPLAVDQTTNHIYATFPDGSLVVFDMRGRLLHRYLFSEEGDGPTDLICLPKGRVFVRTHDRAYVVDIGATVN